MTVYRENALFPILGLILISSVAFGITLDGIPRRSSLHGFKSDYHKKYGDSEEEPMERIARNKLEAIRKPGLFTTIETVRAPHDAAADISGRPHIFREHMKRDTKKSRGDLGKAHEKDNQELIDILKDDENEKKPVIKDRKYAQDIKTKDQNPKRKRESTEPEITSAETQQLEDHQTAEPEKSNHNFQDWLRKEYYRNMAKSFATMRKKRDMWGPVVESSEPIAESFNANKMPKTHHDFSHSRSPVEEEDRKDVGFEDVTDNLEAIKNALLVDVLKVYKAKGKHALEDEKTWRRVTNDINAAYDIETVRTAFFRLADVLSNMDDEADEPETDIFSKPNEKRADQCPPLNVLTSDCAILGDIVPDDSLKELLTHACNWHEVCYSCGEVFGLSSDNCDMGFLEKSRTICRGDVPCDTTASLLVMPLRQRRVFYKRSNPAVCLMDPCVEDFLTRA